MFSAVYQGGLFGVCGMMPPKYTGAVMTGQVGTSTCLVLTFIFACCCAMGMMLPHLWLVSDIFCILALL